MKIVVFGPFKRTGALHAESGVDLSRAYAKYRRSERLNPIRSKWRMSSCRLIWCV
jgi:hypothetical protein